MPPSLVVDRLTGIGERRAVKTAIRRLEEYATPAEFAAAMEMKRLLPIETYRILKKSFVIRHVTKKTPEPYLRSELSPNVFFYQGPGTGSQPKTLLVAFAGAAMRLMLPLSIVLQSLPAESHDVVLIRDPGRHHFEHGIPDYANSLLGLMQRLRADLSAERYDRVVTLGTSMGGLPALRGGTLIGADLAVSIGGQPIWHIDRLIDPNRREIPAFEMLCACGPTGPELLLLYAAGNAEDVKGADLVAMTRPVRRIPVADQNHNILLPIVRAGLADGLIPALVAGDASAAESIFADLPQDETEMAVA